jgi:hypothetical protein
MRNTKIKIIY